ncbi:MAG: type II secretion system protein GspN [Nitrospirota bacterium]
MIRIAGYAGLFLVVLLTTVYLRFPYAEMARRQLGSMEAPAGLAIDFATLGPSGLGLSGTRLRVVRRGADGAPLFAAASFRVGGLVRSATGPMYLDGRFQAYGGELRTAVEERGGGSYGVGVDGEGLHLGALIAPFSERFAGVRGEVGGRIEFAGAPARWIAGSGKVDVTGGPGSIAGVAFFGQALPEVPFERLVARAQLDKGVLQIEEAALSGTDLSANIDGRIRLRLPLPQSILDLSCTLRLPPAVIGSLQGLKDIASVYEQDDGSYQFQLKGTFVRPRLR